MDEQTVREYAEAHGAATQSGDLRRAGEDLTENAKAQAGGVMRAMPAPITAAEIASIEADGEEFVVLIRYAGEATETMVESRWVDRDGRPMILDLKVV